MKERVAVIGGGAAGMFAAVTTARLLGGNGEVHVLERGKEFLSKVRISGGGRCNVTHACFDPRELAKSYPRGARELRGAFHRFQPGDTIEWFKQRGVVLKTEEDGRMFPVTDSSSTIIECFLAEAKLQNVRLRAKTGVRSLERGANGWAITRDDGEVEEVSKVLVATGGVKSGGWLEALGHTVEPPVPSLFTFHLCEEEQLKGLAGVSLSDVELRIPGMKWHWRGPVLVTHLGLSGPAVLKLSAFAARDLYEKRFRFPLRVNWLPAWGEHRLRDWLVEMRKSFPAKKPVNTPLPNFPNRLWEWMLKDADGLTEETRWTTFSKSTANCLVERLLRDERTVAGKSMNKEEFVTCGGIRLSEVDFQTMQSKRYEGLFFAGEVLDVDGITGGFNFQAAWTTGWLAGHAMAERKPE